MALKVNISFKNTEKEMYDFLLSQLSPSIYLKELIKKEMGKREEQAPTKNQNSGVNLDF